MKHFSILAVAILFLCGAATAGELRLAVTTSFENSGLSDVLLPEIQSDLGLKVQLLVVGTGQAMRLGKGGDVDAILVHSRTSEDAFVADGHGTHRTEIMYNDYVLIGPKDDPANVSASKSATMALMKIADFQASFVSRGDDSGTNKKEISLWEDAGISEQKRIPGWYKETGSGMGATLNTASGLNAYVLSDRASWLKFGNKGDLKLLFSGDPKLFNQYAFIPVNSKKHPHVKSDLVAKLEKWLTSERAKFLINGYTIDQEKLFTFNAQQM